MTERQRLLLAHLVERHESAKQAYVDQKQYNHDYQEEIGNVPINYLEKEAELWGKAIGLSFGVVALRDALTGPDDDRVS
jgi:hypothetical protein